MHESLKVYHQFQKDTLHRRLLSSINLLASSMKKKSKYYFTRKNLDFPPLILPPDNWSFKVTLAFCHSLDFVLFQTLSATCANSWTRAQEKRREGNPQFSVLFSSKMHHFFCNFLKLVFLLILKMWSKKKEMSHLVNFNTLRKFFMIKDTLLYADNNAIFAFVRPWDKS